MDSTGDEDHWLQDPKEPKQTKQTKRLKGTNPDSHLN